MKRLPALVLAVLFVLPLVFGAAVSVAAAPNGTHTPTPSPTPNATATPEPTPTATSSTATLVNESDWEPPGPHTLNELKAGGESFPGGEPSMRIIGSYSMMWMQHTGVGGAAQTEYLNTSRSITTTEIDVTAWRMGVEESANYTLHVVYFQEATRTVTVGERTEEVRYAANQTHEQKQLILGPYKTETTISIRGFYDQPMQMTMWLENSQGERIATWPVYTIETVETSRPLNIDDEHGFWVTAFTRFGWVILIGLPVGFFAGRKTLERTITGTGYGLGGWAVVAGLLGLLVWFTYTYQTATVLTRFPQLPGVVTTIIVYLGYIEVVGPDIETGEFQRKDLEETTALTTRQTSSEDDGPAEVMRARHRHIVHKDIVRQDGRIYFLTGGVLPFLARLWTDPPHKDESELKQLDRASGDVDWYFEVDPQRMDEPVVHEAESLGFDLSFRRELTEEERAACRQRLAGLDDHHWAVAAVLSLRLSLGAGLRSVKWVKLATVGGGFAGAYGVIMLAFGLPSLGLGAGALVALAVTTRPQPGRAHVEFAPYQFNTAETTRSRDLERYKEARTFDDLMDLFKEMDFAEIDAWEEAAQTLRQKYQEEYNKRFRTNTGDEADRQPATPTQSDDD